MHETFGFPLELTREIAAAKGIKVDEEGYEKAKEAASAKSRSYADEMSKEKVKILQRLENTYPATQFTGYETLQQKARVLAMLTDEFEEVKSLNGRGYAVFDQTSFYAESGGQVGDSGNIVKDGQTVAQVLDVKKPIGKVFLHRFEGALNVGEEVLLCVDKEARRRAAANRAQVTAVLPLPLCMAASISALMPLLPK